MKLYRIPEAGNIDKLVVAEAPLPKPARGQVLVRIRAASLNYRDLMIVQGRYGAGEVRANLIPLSDGAGEVVETGPDVGRVKAGDRVAAIFHQSWIAGSVFSGVRGSALGGDLDGVLAEYCLFEQSGLVRLPQHLSFEEGATLPCAAVTAWNALFGLRPVQPGDVVLALGTGGVSVFAMQFASAAGARVIATSSSDEKLERVKSVGAREGVNYRDRPEWHEDVLALTGGNGADHIIEVAGPGTLPRSLRCAAMGGIVHVIGMVAGMGEINPLVLIPRAITMRGIYVGSREMFEAMNRAIETHQIRPVIDRVFPFDEAREAYRYLESGAHVGKVVIRI